MKKLLDELAASPFATQKMTNMSRGEIRNAMRDLGDAIGAKLLDIANKSPSPTINQHFGVQTNADNFKNYVSGLIKNL